MLWREFREQIMPLLYGGEATMEELQEALILMYEHHIFFGYMVIICLALCTSLALLRVMDVFKSSLDDSKVENYIFEGEQGSGRKGER